MSNEYLYSLQFNLPHLRTLIPRQPKRNLATGPTVPDTETDAYLTSRIHWSTIPGGHMGTHITLEKMAEQARTASHDVNFQKFARQFHSLHEMEGWVRDHFIYRDESEEILRTPQFMLRDMGRISQDRVIGLEGDCDDIAGFLAAVTYTMGYPTRLVAIRTHSDNPSFEHVFSEANDGNQWVTLDPTVDPGTEIHSIDDMVVMV